MDIPYYREYELPWTSSSGQEQKFRRLLAIVFAVLFFLGAVWPFLPTPAVDPNAIEEIPPRIAKLLLEQKPPPPPPPKVKEPEPEPVKDPIKEPEPEKVVEKKPEPPKPEPEPIDMQKVAREQAQAALLPFTEDLAALADSDVLEKLADERPLTASVGQAARNERSMITSKAGAASGGINTASMSRNTGGSGLAGRTTSQIESPVAAVGQSAGGARRTGESGKASRSREEIELVFDKNKGAIFALYNRALRADPTLEGKLVLRLTIAPSGEVTFCEVVSSELGDQDLEQRLVQRVRMFRFEAKDVEAITTTKPIDFFPA
ncbi:MAG: TonB family protein [Gammaproteobacteria bacterium]|nr:TonB family protein [Gammaproteobacteria bacterium]MDH4314671.1 TonB family protein [Gammaproteobacteria bacterium]MDH5213382.1 TonB family protein [Gammaproteobacteria bacterium]